MNEMQWICPVCKKALSDDGHRLFCANRHSFDCARQGYVNLLPPQKHAAHPGDGADMVAARTSFLTAGYYEGFSDGVNTLCTDALRSSMSDGTVPSLADAGCGEGYYTRRLYRSLKEAGIPARLAGFDLSKEAVSHAAADAKRDGTAAAVSYAVASLFDMPLADASCDGVLNLFAPVADAEFARILKPDGFLLMAVPAPRHLYGLKTALYEKPYENEVRRDVLPSFMLTEVRTVAYTVTLRSPADIGNLFLMTPYYFRTSQKDKDKLTAYETLETPVAFDLLLYRKK